jgi:hypothetical protein
MTINTESNAAVPSHTPVYLQVVAQPLNDGAAVGHRALQRVHRPRWLAVHALGACTIKRKRFTLDTHCTMWQLKTSLELMPECKGERQNVCL